MNIRKQTVFLKYDTVLEQMGENIKVARKRRKLTTLQVSEPESSPKLVEDQKLRINISRGNYLIQ